MARTIRDLIIGFKFSADMAPVKRLSSAIENLKARARDAGGGLAGFQAACTSLGGAMTHLGRDMTMKVSAPLAALGGLAAKAAIDFESAFAGVKKTVTATPEQLAKIEKQIRKMATTIPASAVDIAKVAEAAGQLGIKTDNIMGFTRVMVDLGNATNLSAEEGATQLARFANITGMSQTKFSNLGSTIVALGNNMATTEADIVSMGMRLAGVGKQVGLTEAQTMGFAAALSSVGIEAEAGGTAFSRVFTDMQLAAQLGGKSLAKFAVVSGVSADEFKKRFTKDASGTMILFLKRLEAIRKKGGSVAGILKEMGLDDIRVADALKRASASGDLFAKSLKLGEDAFASNNALSKEAAQRYATLASRMKTAKNKATEAGIVFGTELMPKIEKMVEVLGKLADRFAQLDPTTRDWIINLGLIAMAAGPVMFILGGLVKVFGALAAAIESAPVIAFMAAFFGITAVTVGVGLAIGGVVIAIMDLYTYLTTGESIFGSFWEGWVSGVDNARASFLGLGTAFKEIFTQGLADWQAGWETIKATVGSAVDWIISKIAAIPTAIANAASGLKNLALNAIGFGATVPGANGRVPSGGKGGNTYNIRGGDQTVNAYSPQTARVAVAGGPPAVPRTYPPPRG